MIYDVTMYIKIVQNTGRVRLPLDFSYFMEIQPKREVHINRYGKINGCNF